MVGSVSVPNQHEAGLLGEWNKIMGKVVVTTATFNCDKMVPTCDTSVPITDGMPDPFGFILITVSADADNTGDMQGSKSKLYFCDDCMTVFNKKFGKMFAGGEVTKLVERQTATGKWYENDVKRRAYTAGKKDLTWAINTRRISQDIKDWHENLTGGAREELDAKFAEVKPVSGVPAVTSGDDSDD